MYSKYDKKHTPTISLAHELGHAWDGIKGILYPNYNNEKDNLRHKGILYGEWRAVYHENMIRKELGIPLRQYYFLDIIDGSYKPHGSKMLDKKNNIKFLPLQLKNEEIKFNAILRNLYSILRLLCA